MLLIELAVEALDVFRWLERLEGGRVPKPEVLLMLLVDACDRSGFAGSAARSASVLRFVGGSGSPLGLCLDGMLLDGGGI